MEIVQVQAQRLPKWLNTAATAMSTHRPVPAARIGGIDNAERHEVGDVALVVGLDEPHLEIGACLDEHTSPLGGLEDRMAGFGIEDCRSMAPLGRRDFRVLARCDGQLESRGRALGSSGTAARSVSPGGWLVGTAVTGTDSGSPVWHIRLTVSVRSPAFEAAIDSQTAGMEAPTCVVPCPGSGFLAQV